MSMSAGDTLVYRVRPGRSEPRGALVLFHGRGADEDDLYAVLDALDPEQRLLGITPRGPLPLPPGGAHWYAVGRVGYPEPQTFHSTLGRVTAWLAALAEETGIPPERTVLGGFSQGAVMSYALGLGTGRPRPAAVVALSGFIPTVERFEVDFDRPLPPVAIGHGAHDEVIPVDFARRARDLLQRAGADVLYHESPMTHAIDPAFLDGVARWLRRILEGASTPPGR